MRAYSLDLRQKIVAAVERGDSTLKAAHQPSPTATTPAFSPGGTMTRSPFVGRRLRCVREDLYEQCSDYITEKTPSST